MNIRTILSIAALASALAAPSLGMAQETHMISGKAVPADQVTAVQTKCNELHKAAPAAPAAAAKPAAPAAAATPAPAAGTVGWSADGKTIDLTKLTVALCNEAMFPAPAM